MSLQTKNKWTKKFQTSDFQENGFLFRKIYKSPTILVYYEKVNFTVSTKLVHSCKSYELSRFWDLLFMLDERVLESI